MSFVSADRCRGHTAGPFSAARPLPGRSPSPAADSVGNEAAFLMATTRPRAVN